MASTFVAAAGGCSSPSAKDAVEALKGLGEIKLKVLKQRGRGEDWRDARVMIRHPNFTGMQMDVETRAYTPAHFINSVEVRNDKGTVFQIESGISISENPHLRFTYGTATDEVLKVRASDSTGKRFATLPANAEF